MGTYDLEFLFKGGRPYVHGTDIYNKVASFASKELQIKKIKDITYSLHQVMQTGLHIDIYRERTSRQDNTSVVFSFKDGENFYELHLSENGQEITDGYEYPENSIVDACSVHMEQQSIELTTEQPFTDIELLVAMNKGLLNTLFPDGPMKWYFTKLELTGYQEKSSFNSLRLELKRNLQFKLTKTAVIMDGQPLGFIYFSKAT